MKCLIDASCVDVRQIRPGRVGKVDCLFHGYITSRNLLRGERLREGGVYGIDDRADGRDGALGRDEDVHDGDGHWGGRTDDARCEIRGRLRDNSVDEED